MNADNQPAQPLAPGISVVVPVYNSQDTLRDLANRLEPVLLAQAGAGNFELIFINDGSRDGSWSVIEEIAQRCTWVHGINMMRNYGQHNALLCGIRAAQFETTISLDDDLQHPPEEIPKLLSKFAEGFDVVYGAPRAMPHSMTRNILSRGTKKALGAAMGVSGIVDINAFRVFRTDVRRGFDNFRSPNPMIDILLSWGAGRFASVHVNHEPRRVGKSNYTLWKLFNQAMLLITGFSTAPLRIASLVGFAFTLFGIGVFAYVVIKYFVAGSLPGFPFLASIVALFSGAQLFALGIIGEYLARMFYRTMEKPGYVVRETRGTQSRVMGKSEAPRREPA